MQKKLASTHFFNISLIVVAMILFVVAYFFDGTGGGGDSIYHYLYAKYAGQNPENFFNHWAKPIYTMLAFPFSQFGFLGIKVFNILMSLTACYFTYKSLQELKVVNSQFIVIILFSITLFVKVTLSGLTEPLSAAILMVSIYFVLSNKTIQGVSLISFLPFIRSEGLVILGVFFVFLVISKKYKFIPLLGIGHIVLSVIGYIFYHDLLWVLNKIPYAHLSSVYGKGNWFHFIDQLYFQIGLPIYVFFIMGTISMFLMLVKSKVSFVDPKLWLIYGCFFSFFIAHTSFWALGIFNSMGLSRVFVSVMPLLAIIALDGINFLFTFTSKLNTKWITSLKIVLLLLVIIFPFIKTPSSYKIPADFVLEDSQKLVKYKIVPYLTKHKQGKNIVFSDICIPFFLNINPFNKSAVYLFSDKPNLSQIDTNTVVIWDNWFSDLEFSIKKENLNQIPSLKLDTAFSILSAEGRYSEYSIYSKK